MADRLLIFGADDADLRQHCRMRQGALDVLPPQLLVEADRGVDLLHHHRWAGGEAAPPLLVGLGVAACVPVGVTGVRRLAHERGSDMQSLNRRSLLRAGLAVGGTLAAGLGARKPRAATLAPLADGLKLVDPPVRPAP